MFGTYTDQRLEDDRAVLGHRCQSISASRLTAEAGQYAAAVAAVKEKGVLSGKRVERRESGAPGEFADLENMSAGELAEFIRKQAEESLH
jgi:hypothetical protein